MVKKTEIILTNEQYLKLKEESKQPYLTQKEFVEWKDNHFMHLMVKVARIDGIVWVIAGLSLVILGIVLKIAFG